MDMSNLQPFFDSALKALMGHQWALLAALALMAAMHLVKAFLAPHVPFLQSKLGGWLSLLAMSCAGAVATALGTGAHMSPALFLAALGVGFTAAGGYEALRDFLPGSWALIGDLVVRVFPYVEKAIEKGGADQALASAQSAGDKAAQTSLAASGAPKTVADIVHAAAAEAPKS
jgi:hypothetical protein